ncbi:MAG: hypothetical protein AAB408_02980, partial [Patescibacteria group bacterium]
MYQDTKKKFIAYHVHEYASVEAAIQLLYSLSGHEQFDMESDSSVWYCLNIIAEEIKHKDIAHPDWAMKQAVIGLLDADLLKDVYTALRPLVSNDVSLSGEPRVQIGESKNLSFEPEMATILLIDIGCTPDFASETVNRWVADPARFAELITTLPEKKRVTELLYEQARVVCAFLNGFSSLRLYEAKEMIAMLSSASFEALNPIRFVLSLRAGIGDKYAREAVIYICQSILSRPWYETELKWFPACVYTIFLHLAWRWFNLLPTESQL